MVRATPDESALNGILADDDQETRAAWHTILEQLAAKFDATVAQVCYFDLARPGDDKLLFEVTTGMDFNDKVRSLYLKYGSDDPRLAAAHDRPNQALSCREVVDEPTLHASDIYRHLLEPLGLEYTMWIHEPGPGEQLTVWGVMRGADSKPFTRAERERFQNLVPTFRAATAVHRLSVLPNEKGPMTGSSAGSAPAAEPGN